MNFTETLQNITKKSLSDCSNQELYLALLEIVRQKTVIQQPDQPWSVRGSPRCSGCCRQESVRY